MKKLGFILMLSCIALLTSCKDDKDDDVKPGAKDYAKEIAGRYAGKDGLAVTLPAMGDSPAQTIVSDGAITIVRANDNKINLELKDFKFGELPVGDIMLNDIAVEGNDKEVIIKETVFKNYKLGILPTPITITLKPGKVVGDKIDLALSITEVFNDAIDVTFKGTKNNKSGEAQLSELKATHASLDGVVAFDEKKKEFNLYLKTDAKLEDLKDVVLTFKVSDKATSSPKSEDKVDLSKGSVTITVTAEDGVMKNIYTVKVAGTKFVYDMEEWVDENPAADIDDLFAPAGGWGTSNIGAHMIEGITGIFRNVTKTEDAHSGKYAAKLETLHSDNGGEKFFGIMYVPVVTPASLFLGTFNLAGAMAGSPLMSTEFGIDFNKKPISFKGYYKYEAGKVFYTCDNPKEYQYARKDATRTDEGSINAVLYEITTNSKPLTGADVYTSDRLVARAEFNAKSQKEYAKFTADFKFVDGKTYDKSKKYRIAIIASSSRYGDTFSGAPGSTLYVDDLEIVAE